MPRTAVSGAARYAAGSVTSGSMDSRGSVWRGRNRLADGVPDRDWTGQTLFYQL